MEQVESVVRIVDDSVARQVFKSQFLVERCHRFNLLLLGRGGVGEPAVELDGIVACRVVASIYQEEGLLVVDNVATYLLAKGCGVAPHVEVVVLQLERQAQVHCHVVDGTGILLGGMCHESARLASTSQQHRGLEANHLDILVDGDIVTALEVHVKLLTLIHFHGSVVKQFHHGLDDVGIDARNGLGCHGEHSVATQDCHVIVPLAVNGGLATAHVGTVHHVVVKQREVVEQFNAQCHVDSLVEVAAHRLTGHEGEDRTHALAALRHGVGDWFIELGWP